MSTLKEYRVVRRHTGDKAYAVGDIREAREADVKHLVPHVLQPIGDAPEAPAEPEGKAEPAPLNKAEVAPANKAARRRKSKEA